MNKQPFRGTSSISKTFKHNKIRVAIVLRDRYPVTSNNLVFFKSIKLESCWYILCYNINKLMHEKPNESNRESYHSHHDPTIPIQARRLLFEPVLECQQ